VRAASPRRALAALTLLAGCASAEPLAADQLDALGGDRYRFVTKASMMQPAASRQAEVARLRRLDRLLAERGLCPRGHRVIAREPPLLVETDTRYEYAIIDIVYVTQCVT